MSGMMTAYVLRSDEHDLMYTSYVRDQNDFRDLALSVEGSPVLRVHVEQCSVEADVS